MAPENLYHHPTLYDLEYQEQTEDVIFYVKAASQCGGPVLELGCGNGRITLPIARAGIDVTGIDQAIPMLDHLHTRLSLEPSAVAGRVRILSGDFRALSELGRFPLVILPFNALHHCANHVDVLSVLHGVRRSLAPDGRFLLDCYLPDPALYQRNPNQRYEERVFIDPRTHSPLTTWERSWYDPLEQVHHVTYIYKPQNKPETEVSLSLRMFYPQELRALLDWAGFSIVREASDFKGTPLSGASLKWVMELRANRA